MYTISAHTEKTGHIGLSSLETAVFMAKNKLTDDMPHKELQVLTCLMQGEEIQYKEKGEKK
jgi:hypothetical protein